MKPTRLLGIALLGLLSGCPGPVKEGNGPTMRLADCKAGPDQTCPVGRVCKVDIKLDAGVPVLPKTLFIDPGAGAVHIVWKAPNGHRFIAAKQDGIFVKSDDKDQFADNFPTEDDEGVAGDKKKGRNYHWRFENTVKSTYDYSVHFRENGANPKVYACDPRINNQGA